MSYRIEIKRNRRAAARFIGTVRRRLVRALADNPDVKQSDIATALDVHRSVITRQLKGSADLSLGRVAEIAWALGYRPKFELEKIELGDGRNVTVDDVIRPSTPQEIKIVTTASPSNTVVSKSIRVPESVSA